MKLDFFPLFCLTSFPAGIEAIWDSELIPWITKELLNKLLFPGAS